MMSKLDLRFNEAIFGLMGCLFGFGGHGINYVVRHGGFTIGSYSLEPYMGNFAIAIGTAFWAGALSSLSRYKGLSPRWGLTGIAMLSPFTAMIPWVCLRMQKSEAFNGMESLSRYREIYHAGYEEAPELNMRFLGVTFDERYFDGSIGSAPDPWAKHVFDRKSEPSQEIRRVPIAIRPTRKYMW